MAITGLVRFAAVSLLVSAFACFGDELTDQEVRQGIVKFLMPRCGGNAGENDPPGPALAEYLGLGGDTSRIARLLAEVAETNSAWYSEMAMHELARYGTPAQLPFLYSCATNPAIGDRAVKAVLRIEGLTSNSVSSAQRYFALTNVPDSVDRSRTSICADLITLAGLDGVETRCRSNALEVAERFIAAPDCNAYWLDRLLLERDATYRCSKRRLVNLRNSAVYAAQWEFIYNYVTNAINELVAYPEGELPD